MNNRFRRQISAALLVAGVQLILSCAGPPEVGITEDTQYDEKPMVLYRHDYQLGAGDTLEIVYHYTPRPDTSVYYLAVGDIIKIEFAYHPDMNRNLTVRPDGNISIPRKGDVRVLGLTPDQVKMKLEELFALDFKEPVITITMVQYNRAIDHLKKAITTAPRGQSKLTTIRPDGWVSFPVVNDVFAAGKTLPELRKEVQEEYSKLIDHLTVTLILKIMQANLVYISGEVKNPEQYLLVGPTTVAQLISRAGGVLPSAEKRTVLVITRDEDKKPLARLLDLEMILREGNIGKDILLQQYDVVYVPKSSIARRNIFMSQYINGMIPEFFTAGYDIGGTLIDHEPLIK